MPPPPVLPPLSHSHVSWGLINEANREGAGKKTGTVTTSSIAKRASERARMLLLFAVSHCSLLSASAAFAFALGENENMPRNAVSILLTKVSPLVNVRSVSRQADLFVIWMHRLHTILRAELSPGQIFSRSLTLYRKARNTRTGGTTCQEFPSAVIASYVI